MGTVYHKILYKTCKSWYFDPVSITTSGTRSRRALYFAVTDVVGSTAVSDIAIRESAHVTGCLFFCERRRKLWCLVNIKAGDLCWYRRKRTLDDTHPAEPTRGRILYPTRSACVINPYNICALFMLLSRHTHAISAYEHNCTMADAMLYNCTSDKAFWCRMHRWHVGCSNLVRMTTLARHMLSGRACRAISITRQSHNHWHD